MAVTVIVDTGLSNIDSVARAVEEANSAVRVTCDPDDLTLATHLILPGVGSFPAAMERLSSNGLDEAIREAAIARSVPTLGICLGMQLLADVGREGSPTSGLGLIPGEVTRLRPQPGERVPHVGWNDVQPRPAATLFRGLADASFYFVHSFAVRPTDESTVAATTDFAGGFVSAVEHGHVFGVQFHPEKSQRAGAALLRNFLVL